jgi:cellulose 1,4-beta-cellobiosidase
MRLDLSRFSRRRLAVVAAGAIVVAGAAVALPVLPAFAATGCGVTYTASPWTESPGVGGFTANITITNVGDPITSWALTFTLPSGQTLGSGWSANWSSSGTAVTGTNLSYNGALAAGGSTGVGFNGRWTGTYSSPTSFKINGATCTGSSTGPTTGPTTNPPTAPPTTNPPTAPPTTRPPTAPPTTNPPTSAPPTTTPPCTTNCPAHVDNPYAGAKGYVNPEWKAKADAEAGGSRVSNTSTAVWLDRIAAIAGTTSSSSNGSMGLRAHLDAALAQSTATVPVVAQFVIYDLPNRDCSALASNGELLIANNGLNIYKTQYIDPIASIMADPKYAKLRISTIIEIDSLPNLITNLSFAKCQEAQSTGAYVQGVQYALNKLHAISNVYTYVDAAHGGWLGWDSNFGPAVNLWTTTVQGTTAGFASVDGFITDTANTTPVSEPFLQDSNLTLNGTQIRSSNFFQWNPYFDEAHFGLALYNALVAKGFSANIGMLIDTSRDGWGGPARPTAVSTSTDVNTYVDQSRIDKRASRGNWCNASGAGLGARPVANPMAHFDAFVWVKPPGESDGSSSLIPNNEGKGFDRMCDPTYGGNALNNNQPTGALPNAPISGAWFSAQFQQLMANASPAL